MTPRDIKRLRRTRQWSVKDLAGRLGVSPRTVEGWEQGRPMKNWAVVALTRLLN